MVDKKVLNYGAGLTAKVIFLLVILNHFCVKNVNGVSLVEDGNPYRHSYKLDDHGKYFLEWEVLWLEKRVIFNVTVETTGYVGFGLSRKGKMAGADIVIGGIAPNGKPYFSDRHGIGQELPLEDDSPDYTLHSAWEDDTHTFLSFSRAFETCDDENDLPITNDVTALIWAYGEEDNEFEYHHQNRGSFTTYLLDPELAPRGVQADHRSIEVLGNDSNIEILSLTGTQLIPAKHTTYFCSIHKVVSKGKRHIIGYNSVLPTELERAHTHHFILHRCHAPIGQNPEDIFEPLLGSKEECYILNEPKGKIPTNYCLEMYYVWGAGELPFFLPEHTGLPLGESHTEYYMFQIHFNNPNKIPGMTANYALEIFATPNLREHDAGILNFGLGFPASPGILVPPNSLSHTIYGHCGSSCTRLILPQEGIKAFAINLHTHYAGRKVKLHQIRNNKELPPIAYDDNFIPTFQKTRLFKKERTILPGDQLINSCVYDNTDQNGTVTIGGFNPYNEMCVGALYYYNKIPNRAICGSELRSDEYRKFLGIYETNWSEEALENIVGTSPNGVSSGLRVSEATNHHIDWTIEKRHQLQRLHRNLPQITICPPLASEANDATNLQGLGGLVSIRRKFLEDRKHSPEGGDEVDLNVDAELPYFHHDNLDHHSNLYPPEYDTIFGANSDLKRIYLKGKRRFDEDSSEENDSSEESSESDDNALRRSAYSEHSHYSKEVANPDFEFVSIYKASALPYQPPVSTCRAYKSYYHKK